MTFFSIASHELRTPLTVIAGNVDMILGGFGEKEMSGEVADVLRDTGQATDRLIKMVNTFLNVSRLDQGRVKMAISDGDVVKLVSEVVEELRPLAEARGVALEVELKVESLPAQIDTDKTKEILINLIGNSLKFTKQGSINVKLEQEEGYFKVGVVDTGIGIEQEKQKLLFQRFQQAMNRTLNREAGGTGLGLYISREFARLMGGDLVLVWSEFGKGSEFSLNLPVKQIDKGSKDKKSEVLKAQGESVV